MNETQITTLQAETRARKQDWFIDRTREGSINLGDRVQNKVHGTYQEAVDAAHALWNGLKHKTSVTLHSDKWCLYFWHRINADGEVEERNTNSGVEYVQSYPVAYDGNFFVAA